MAGEQLTVPEAMQHALVLAAERPVQGPNPRVGCVLLGRDIAAEARGQASRPVLGTGRNHGVGTPHAEAEALADAARRRADVWGATAVVTLEPCGHVGRTPSCADALLAAGVAEVVYAVDDPNPVAAGGGERLRSSGVAVRSGLLAAEGEETLGAWLHAVRAGRPFVTLKSATTLDGRVAAPDGTSRWITGSESRAHAHQVRASVDAIVVGTGTVLIDDPSLTARRADGSLAETQPLRVVVGRREVPASAAVRGSGGGEFVQVLSRDPGELLAFLQAREVRHVLVEGGPTVAAAMVRAGVVDEVHAYVAPVLLGAGQSAVADVGVSTIADAWRLSTVDVRRLGEDVLVVARPVPVVSEVEG